MAVSVSAQKKGKKVAVGTIVLPKDKALLICILILIYVYFVGFFTYNFGLSEIAYYITDALLILCLVLSFNRTKRIIFSNRLRLFSALLILLLVITTLSALLHGFKPLLWLWSLRNWGRFFLYFYLCSALFSEKWVNKLLAMTINIFILNVFVIIVQYFVIKGYPQDALNGLVGRNTSGANIVLTMAAAIIVSSEYVRKQCTARKLIIVFLGVLIVSILAELKAIVIFAFLSFSIILLVNSRLTVKQTARFIVLGIVATIVSVFALHVLVRVYPEFADVLSIEGLFGSVANERGYGYVGYIDRLTAIKVVNRDIFRNELIHRFFGIGMGNAEYSAFAGLTSAFYYSYGVMYRYLGFCVAILYIEGGYIGFGLFVALFVVIIINCTGSISILKKKVNANTACYYESIGLGMAFFALICIWYNNLLRTDMAALVAFYMAIPFALSRKGENGADKKYC